ncbi:MAG: arsinothricin resistance N-acetyltransferase ArsN1 family A [Aggregatilineales bacterium]
MALSTRLATLEDAPIIAEIYNQGIEDRTATFETRPRSADDVRQWFDGRHPVVVVEDSGKVVAFASTSTYRPRDCYAGIAEYSVYVTREARGHGAGRAAMQALIAKAQNAAYWKLVSRIFVENTTSRRLMQSLGFREVGIYEKHGQLDGVWRDVVIVELLIPVNLKNREQPMEDKIFVDLDESLAAVKFKGRWRFFHDVETMFLLDYSAFDSDYVPVPGEFRYGTLIVDESNAEQWMNELTHELTPQQLLHTYWRDTRRRVELTFVIDFDEKLWVGQMWHMDQSPLQDYQPDGWLTGEDEARKRLRRNFQTKRQLLNWRDS